MKKLLIIILIAAAIGAFFSVLLLIDHYHPEIGLAACGQPDDDGCRQLNQSAYAIFLNIPIAAWGAAYFGLILLMALVTLNSQGNYYKHACAFLILFSLPGLGVQAFLTWVMLSTGLLCPYCAAAHVAGIIIFALSLALYLKLRRSGRFSLIGEAAALFRPGGKSPDQNAATLLAAVAMLLICGNIYLTVYILNMESKDEVSRTLKQFYEQPAEPVALPEGLAVYKNKDGAVKIMVFTDWLCSACFRFHEVEAEVMDGFKDRVSLFYYNYPLDSACNEDMQSPVYAGSCLAARAMLAAARMGFFKAYADRHFIAYRQIYNDYNETTARRLASGLADSNKFQEMMDSPETAGALRRDLELARKLNVQTTPTIFINGRRLAGSPSRELLQKILETEINRNRVNRVKQGLKLMD